MPFLIREGSKTAGYGVVKAILDLKASAAGPDQLRPKLPLRINASSVFLSAFCYPPLPRWARQVLRFVCGAHRKTATSSASGLPVNGERLYFCSFNFRNRSSCEST
jgi:hypothetical protein